MEIVRFLLVRIMVSHPRKLFEEVILQYYFSIIHFNQVVHFEQAVVHIFVFFS